MAHAILGAIPRMDKRRAPLARLYHWDWHCEAILEDIDYVNHQTFEKLACYKDEKLDLLDIKLCHYCLSEVIGLYGNPYDYK